jgi:hypothetical protein
MGTIGKKLIIYIYINDFNYSSINQIFLILGRSFGGIGNVIQFIINEGFTPKSYDTTYNNDIVLENTKSNKSNINSGDNKIIIINEDND